MPGGGLATSPGTPGHSAQRVTGAPTSLSLGGGSEDKQDQDREGLQGLWHFWVEGWARLDPVPEGELLSSAAIVPALCTQGNGHLYCLKRTKWHQAPWQRGSCHPWEMVLFL